MNIGMSREIDLVASLRHELGDLIGYRIDNNLTEDFTLNSLKFSIKHSQSSMATPIKINWNVGLCQESIQTIIDAPPEHYPNLLLSYINLQHKTIDFVCVSSETNRTVIKELGIDAFRIPRGNARGIEYSRKAMVQLIANRHFCVKIHNANLNGGMDPIERRMLLIAD
jgi:hypothetical protein